MSTIRSLGMTAVLLGALFVQTAFAKGSMTEGTVMMTSATSLLIIGKTGDPVEFSVPSTAKITRDGKPVKLEQLQSRDQVSVLATGEDHVATDVHARSPF